jgi:hypothetical protein
MRIGIVIILIFCVEGCRKSNDLPVGILKNDKMQAVLWDVILAEAYTTQYIKKDSLKNDSLENAKFQQEIFAIHNITKKEFYDSYQYYTIHAELMRTLLDSLTVKGEREKEKVLHGKLPTTNGPKPILIMAPPTTAPEKITLIPMPITTTEPIKNLVPLQNSLPAKSSRPVFPSIRPNQ